MIKMIKLLDLLSVPVHANLALHENCKSSHNDVSAPLEICFEGKCDAHLLRRSTFQ
jgi:hypothetical protein